MGTTAQIGNIGPFDILSFSFGPQYASAVTAIGGTGSTKAQVSDVMVSRIGDANSATLAQASAAGTPFDSATITMNDSSGTRVLTFSNVFISSFKASSTGGNATPTELLDLNFTQMTTNLSPYDDASASGGVCTMDGSADQSDDSDSSSSLASDASN